MKAEKTPFLVLLGPSLLLITLVLLFCKTAFLLGRPAWMFGMSISTLLGCGISYLGFQELRSREERLFSRYAQKEKEAESFRSALDETHLLYKEKIAKLEELIATSEKESREALEEKQKELKDLQEGYTALFEQSTEYKSQANAFQISLDDALNEVRDLRQHEYLENVQQKKMPKDLLNQHYQLRAQFEEKSVVLDQTRRRLFINEGYLLALQKTYELQRHEPNFEQERLIESIHELLEENAQLEAEIISLEQLLALPPQKNVAPVKKGKKKLEKMLEFQFDNAP